jgi:hypothetical protein
VFVSIEYRNRLLRKQHDLDRILHERNHSMNNAAKLRGRIEGVSMALDMLDEETRMLEPSP